MASSKLFNEPAKFRTIGKRSFGDEENCDENKPRIPFSRARLFKEKGGWWSSIVNFEERKFGRWWRIMVEHSNVSFRKKEKEETIRQRELKFLEGCKQDLTICGGCGRWTGANVARVSSAIPSLSLSFSLLHTVPQFSVCFTLTKNNGICFRGCCRISAWKSTPFYHVSMCARARTYCILAVYTSRENYNVVRGGRIGVAGQIAGKVWAWKKQKGKIYFRSNVDEYKRR